jgi:hypothetical protein
MKKTLLAALAAFPAIALPQTQVVKPPIAQYWMSVETAAGMQMPGMGPAGAMIGGMMGAQASGGRSLLLQLGSQRQAAGEPRAAHEIPPGMNMGPQLPLLTPRRERAERAPREMPEGMEQPKGRMLLYWGCGENVRPGQPVVIDFARVAQGQAPAGMVSRRVAQPAGPAFGRNRTYGDWPNQEDAKAVPDSASLRGGHQIKGNYSPEIRFSLENDFLERVNLTETANRLRWNAVANATGYFATLYGAQSDQEVVFWSSSEVQEMGGALMDYIPPAEVARLVREKVVLPPAATECAVPGEVVKKAGTPMVSFIAYGPEANFAHPPRPKDPKVAWEPDWAVKVRFKSTASILLGESAEQPRRQAREDRQPEQQSKPAAPDPVQEGVKEGIKTLRGIFGR